MALVKTRKVKFFFREMGFSFREHTFYMGTSAGGATPGEEVPGSIPAPYWLGRSQYNVIG